MATYEEIYGKRVKDFDSDPTLESSYEGQVWYDKSTGVLKSVVAIEAWRSGTSFSTSGYGAAGSGSQTAGLIICRNTDGFWNTPSNATEEYNGSWMGNRWSFINCKILRWRFRNSTAALCGEIEDLILDQVVKLHQKNIMVQVGHQEQHLSTRAVISSGFGIQTAAGVV